MLRVKLLLLLAGLTAGHSLASHANNRPALAATHCLKLRGGAKARSSSRRQDIKDMLRADLQAMDTDSSGTITIDEYIEYNRAEFLKTRNIPHRNAVPGMPLLAGKDLMTDKQWQRFEQNIRRRSVARAK